MAMFTGILISAGVFTFLVYVIRSVLSKHWGCEKKWVEEDVRGKTIIVTGASSGIGKATAIELASRHARVIITARSLEVAKRTVVDIRRKTFYGEVIPMKLDLGSIQSVKEFYHEIIKSFDTIDTLINNAGVLLPSDKIERTSDGFEMHFGVNYLSVFLLNNLLLPLLKNAEDSRVIFVSSGTYQTAKLNFDDLNFEKSSTASEFMSQAFGDFPLYKSSKLAINLFARELAKRLEGTGVKIYSLCPGNVQTQISRNLKVPFLYMIFKAPLVLLTIKTPWQGCRTVLYCALAKECADESGLMYRNCDIWTTDKFYFPDDYLMPPLGSSQGSLLNDCDALRLWNESEKFLQMKFPVV